VPRQEVGEDVSALLTQIIDLLEELVDVTVLPPRFSDLHESEVAVQRVVVVTAGVPTRGPSVAIPFGFPCRIRQRVHGGAPVGYVGFSEGAVRSTQTRIELADENNFQVWISNMDQVWFDADTNNTAFEMWAEV